MKSKRQKLDDNAVGAALVGAHYDKRFIGYGTWTAKVESYDEAGDIYVCVYAGGYSEELTHAQLKKFHLYKPAPGERTELEIDPNEHPGLYIRGQGLQTPRDNEILLSDSDDEASKTPIVNTFTTTRGTSADHPVILIEEGDVEVHSRGRIPVAEAKHVDFCNPPLIPLPPFTSPTGNSSSGVQAMAGATSATSFADIKPEPLPFGMADCPPDVVELTKAQFLGETEGGMETLSSPTASDALIFLGATDTSSVNDLPHRRTACSVHKFTRPKDDLLRNKQQTLFKAFNITDPIKKANSLHCAACFCLACEVPASKCSQWATGDQPHCNATFSSHNTMVTSYWKRQKRIYSNVFLRVIPKLQPSLLHQIESCHDHVKNSFRIYHHGEVHYEHEEGMFDHFDFLRGMFDREPRRYLEHSFRHIRFGFDNSVGDIKRAFRSKNMSDHVDGVCLLDVLTESICKESPDQGESEVVCEDDRWDKDAKSTYDGIIVELGQLWRRILCSSPEGVIKGQPESLPSKVHDGLTATEAIASHLVCPQTRRTLPRHEMLINRCGYFVSQYALAVMYAGKTTKKLKCPKCTNRDQGHLKYAYKKMSTHAPHQVPLPSKTSTEAVRLKPHYVSALVLRLEDVKNISKCRKAKQMLGAIIHIAKAHDGVWDSPCIKQVETGETIIYRGITKDLIPSIDFRIDAAINEGRYLAGCRLMLSSRDSSPRLATSKMHTLLKLKSIEMAQSTMFSQLLNPSKIERILVDIDLNWTMNFSRRKRVGVKWSLCVRSFIGTPVDENGISMDQFVKEQTVILTGDKLGITTSSDVFGRVFVHEVDNSVVSDQVRKNVQPGDLMCAVNGGHICRLGYIQNSEAVWQVHDKMSSAQRPCRILFERPSYLVQQFNGTKENASVWVSLFVRALDHINTLVSREDLLAKHSRAKLIPKTKHISVCDIAMYVDICQAQTYAEEMSRLDDSALIFLFGECTLNDDIDYQFSNLEYGKRVQLTCMIFARSIMKAGAPASTARHVLESLENALSKATYCRKHVRYAVSRVYRWCFNWLASSPDIVTGFGKRFVQESLSYEINGGIAPMVLALKEDVADIEMSYPLLETTDSLKTELVMALVKYVEYMSACTLGEFLNFLARWRDNSKSGIGPSKEEWGIIKKAIRAGVLKALESARNSTERIPEMQVLMKTVSREFNDIIDLQLELELLVLTKILVGRSSELGYRVIVNVEEFVQSINNLLARHKGNSKKEATQNCLKNMCKCLFDVENPTFLSIMQSKNDLNHDFNLRALFDLLVQVYLLFEVDVRKHIRMLLAFPSKPKDVPGNPSSRLKVKILPLGTSIEEYTLIEAYRKNMYLEGLHTEKKLALISMVFAQAGLPEQVRQVFLSECAPWLFYVATTNVRLSNVWFNPLTKALLSLRKYSHIREKFGPGIFAHYANEKFKKMRKKHVRKLGLSVFQNFRINIYKSYNRKNIFRQIVYRRPSSTLALELAEGRVGEKTFVAISKRLQGIKCGEAFEFFDESTGPRRTTNRRVKVGDVLYRVQSIKVFGKSLEEILAIVKNEIRRQQLGVEFTLIRNFHRDNWPFYEAN